MSTSRRAFTLIELLVVIGIIALLVGILFPVIKKIRTSAHSADTRSVLAQLDAAINQYHRDHGAFPGPLAADEIARGGVAPTGLFSTFVYVNPAPPGYDLTTQPNNQAMQKFTDSENLVLGLLGGLHVDVSTGTPRLAYDPTAVGQGAVSLNIAGLPKRSEPYIATSNLSWRNSDVGKTGQYKDDAGAADDTLVPEFLDRFPEGMPIIYLRAHVGAPAIDPNSAGYNEKNNGIITYDSSNALNRVGQYDLHQFLGYTRLDTSNNTSIGVGKSLPKGTKGTKGGYINGDADNKPPAHGLHSVDVKSTMDKSDSTNYVYPFDAFAYFKNPTVPNSPRNKDGYILISAGPDRVYGTPDDICNFGDVAP